MAEITQRLLLILSALLICTTRAQLSSYGAPSDISNLLTSTASTTASTTTSTRASITTSQTSSTDTALLETYSAPSDVSQISTLTATTGTPPSSSGTSDLSTFYCQKGREPAVHCFTPSDFLEADLAKLCPSGNCLDACQSKRVYEVIPSGVTVAYDQYGTMNSTRTEITLFGICVEIANLAKTLTGEVVPTEQANKLKPYFPYSDEAVGKITSNITQCLPSSCSMSRDSSTCHPHCLESELLSPDGSTNLTAVAICLEWLCEESCGLPFANQDVAGIGVSISYIIQATIVILAWLILLGSSIYEHYGQQEEQEWRDIFLESLARFLLVQNYFGIPLAIAAFTLNPFQIDPLNGYGLLAVCATGFMPQIQTLMILHAYDKRSSYISALTVTSWLLSSIVFWALHTNLMGNAAFQDSSFRSLYHIDTCGGSGATALCLQTTDQNPLEFLQDYYYHSVMPGIHTVPMIWVWSTFVLLVLIVRQFRAHREESAQGSQSNLLRPRKNPLVAFLSATFPGRLAYITASILFFLAMAYEAIMFRSYISQFINTQDWAFGQVIAITLWVPPLLDGLHDQIKQSTSSSSTSKKSISYHDDASSTANLNKHQGHQSLNSIHTAYSINSSMNSGRPTSIRVPSRSGDPQSYQALYSPPQHYQPSPDPRGDFNFEQQAGFEARYDAPASGADTYVRRSNDDREGVEEFELRSRPTMRMEEGHSPPGGYEPVRRKPVAR